MVDVDDAPYVSRSTVRRLQTHVRKLRAELDELERWERHQATAPVQADSTDIDEMHRWFLWRRRARLAAVRAELREWAAVLAWGQEQT